MKIVVDTNVLISALLKDATTRQLLWKRSVEWCYPRLALEELRPYLGNIRSKAGSRAVGVVLPLLLRRITLIEDARWHRRFEEAKKIIAHVDVDDVVFIACALTLRCPIWSDDAHFQEQKSILNRRNHPSFPMREMIVASGRQLLIGFSSKKGYFLQTSGRCSQTLHV